MRLIYRIRCIIGLMISLEEKRFLQKMFDHPRSNMLLIELLDDSNSNERMFHKLLSEGYIDEDKEQTVLGGGTISLYGLSAKAYAELRPWWNKVWDFFTDDMAKILSLVAIVISILVGLKQMGAI